MEFDKLVDSIVNEVLSRINCLNKRALILFTGGNIGLEEATEQIKKLKEDGWNMRILLSRSAEKVITPAYITDRLGIARVYLESEVEDEGALLQNTDYIIIPILTMNSAARIALALADTAVSRLVASSIMKGIPIIAAQDACDPGNPVRVSRGYDKIPPAYEKRMLTYLNDLKEYRIQLVQAYQLYGSITGRGPANKPAAAPLHKKLLTREDIVNAKNHGFSKVCISKNTMVTMLAQDAAKELGVELECI